MRTNQLLKSVIWNRSYAPQDDLKGNAVAWIFGPGGTLDQRSHRTFPQCGKKSGIPVVRKVGKEETRLIAIGPLSGEQQTNERFGIEV